MTRACPVCGTSDRYHIQNCLLHGVIPGCLGSEPEEQPKQKPDRKQK